MHRLLPIVVLAGLALSACGDSDEDAGGTGGATTATSVETTETTTVETTTEAEEEGPTKIRITYKSGNLSGDTGTVRVDKGASVQLLVRADVEDEVHLHGYDLAAEVAPGHLAAINFEADDVGKFIVELEHLHLHIVTLRVR